MPIRIPRDTADALGPSAGKCDSRSLFLDRFADPAAKDSGDDHPRRDWFNALHKKVPVTVAGATRGDWIVAFTSAKGGAILHAQLQSRLMVNMAGSVMENAGLCLDRFGLPYIPGTAVKGCARRAALASLHEWCDTGNKPGAASVDSENLFKAACKPFDTPARMLTAIASVFGWCAHDWMDSDFAWACLASRSSALGCAQAPTGHDPKAHGNAPGSGRHIPASAIGAKPPADDSWPALRNHVLRQLARDLRIAVSDDNPCPWKALPNFAGSVSFLPAFPLDLGAAGKVGDLPLTVPTLGQLELDVVTCHHRNYYQEPAEPKNLPQSDARWQRWREDHDRWDREWGTAPDTEEPNPVVLSAIASGHVFAFALAPLRRADPELVQLARTWLQTGLETFGLGAKTNAGYGWFEDVTGKVQRIRDAERAERQRADRERQEADERKAARANLQPDDALVARLEGLNEANLRGRINAFATDEKFWTEKDEKVQFTLLHFMKVVAPDRLSADRANPKSKVYKALANLSVKFSNLQPPLV